ncbi:MAG: energy-coupling factor transporter transmembrane protein EcfT [Oscillospiraceae bacterium]|nr:energy-coupling factor transporter transmembrane protein EcfT [Oscillospiraceae bacterium]
MRFDSYHPAINLLYFAAAIACTVTFNQPVFLCISFACGFLYSVKLNGWKNLLFNVCLVFLAAAYGGWYASYNHFGVTNLLSNYIGNQITLESLAYGLTLGLMVATVIMWLCCIFTLITTDKVVYLLGRISPKLSLFLSILLRAVPRIKTRTRRIEISREGIGLGVRQGNLWQRLRHLLSLISTLITWTMEDFVESASSMKSRGYSLKGRTAFSIYRFDNRDRALVIALFWCLVAVMMAVLFDQTTMYFKPALVMNRITPLSYVFYGAYAVFLLLPLVLQVAGEYKFRKCRASIRSDDGAASRRI